ncbi:MAG: beta-N-acetylhexosaminidase [Bacteroidetes bacterium]|nr:beta-N-acetylhexosaminidase [Bacteroidota bacterium]MCL1968194.1 beta-N-acetylhexosaminidase [Bacteroidota bacterium]
MKHILSHLSFFFRLLLSAFCFLLFSCTPKPIEKTFNIVPQPVEINAYSGSFLLNNMTKVAFENIAPRDASMLYITSAFEKYLEISPTFIIPEKCKRNSIVFRINKTPDPVLGEEGYRLNVSKNKIKIEANSNSGLVYAFETLYQLATDSIEVNKPLNNNFRNIKIPCVKIVDYPRFAWRGMHLDVSRHFFDVEFVKKYIDVLALYKLNVFHWHLTDDHGWRIQIDKYPKLTEVGAWRPEIPNSEWRNPKPYPADAKMTYGGFYTQDEIREVVAYAAARGIHVMPEIELPGHCSAILAAYPEFACDHYPYRVESYGYWPPKAIMCAGNPKVIQFYKDVFDEIIPLFPFEYYHIGGDEALKGNWEKCPKCLAKAKELNLENLEQLQGWMVREIESYLNAKGKKMAGWIEIIDGDCNNTSLIYAWLGKNKTMEAIERGNPIVQCPTSHCYLDYYQADKNTQPEAIGGFIPLGKVYSLEPVYEELNEEQAKQIMGVQFNLWAEFLFTSKQAEYMLLPRILAGAEMAWCTKENKNWERFKKKLPSQKMRLKLLGYNYCDDVVEAPE